MNKAQIFLGGGGSVKMSFQLDEAFFSTLPYHARILYVPIALRRNRIGYESCIDWFSELIARHGDEKEIDFEIMIDDGEAVSFDACDAVYIGGGNTYHLLRYFRQIGMDQKLLAYYQAGGTIYGGSAGALILGKDVRTVEEENDRHDPHHAGLNLLGGMSLYCHYRESEPRDVQLSALTLKIGSPILALPEDSGIRWKNNHVDHIFGRAFMFDGQTRKAL